MKRRCSASCRRESSRTCRSGECSGRSCRGSRTCSTMAAAALRSCSSGSWRGPSPGSSATCSFQARRIWGRRGSASTGVTRRSEARRRAAGRRPGEPPLDALRPRRRRPRRACRPVVGSLMQISAVERPRTGGWRWRCRPSSGSWSLEPEAGDALHGRLVALLPDDESVRSTRAPRGGRGARGEKEKIEKIELSERGGGGLVVPSEFPP